MNTNANFYSKFKIEKLDDADFVNQLHIDNGSFPPYKDNAGILEIKTYNIVSDEFVRFHLDNNQNRNWIVRKSDVKGLTVSQIQDKLALPYAPSHFSNVSLPANTKLRNGLSGSQPQWGVSGGIEQFEIVLESINDRPPLNWFGSANPISQW